MKTLSGDIQVSLKKAGKEIMKIPVDHNFIKLHNHLYKHWKILHAEKDYMYRAHKSISSSLEGMIVCYILFVIAVACSMTCLIPQIVHIFKTYCFILIVIWENHMDNNEKVVDDVNWCARGVNLIK